MMHHEKTKTLPPPKKLSKCAPRPPLPLPRQHLLGFIDFRRQVRRPPRVRVVGDHQLAMRRPHPVGGGRLPHAQDLGGLATGHVGQEAALKSGGGGGEGGVGGGGFSGRPCFPASPLFSLPAHKHTL